MQSQNELSSSVATPPSRARPSASITVAVVQAAEHPKAKPVRLELILSTAERLELYAKSAALS